MLEYVPTDSVLFSIFLIFTGAAVLATVALYLRQAMLIAYIVLGAALGPYGFALISDAKLIQDIAHVGIIFLLFLLGLNLAPRKLIILFKKTLVVTLVSAIMFALTGYLLARLLGFGNQDAVIIGVACVFSSTIIGLKLLPTTVLHHKHTGEVIVSVLLLQDLIAIGALLVFEGLDQNSQAVTYIAVLVAGLPLLCLFAYFFERWVLRRLLLQFDRIQEYIFLVSIGWCLGMAQLAFSAGFSYEIGAFIGGVALASSPIAYFISDSLRPLRDFFLVMFFFAVGAGFNLANFSSILFPAVVLCTVLMCIKPLVFKFVLIRVSESPHLGWETGIRLGQLSEFSLLLIVVALSSGLISSQAADAIQLATIFSFAVSSCWIVLRYPTPIAVSDKLRRD
ncbi:MAG: cation:proton antiporter [Arenicellales bacterium WSBS_2016_MAG_OTU3]